MKSLIIVFLILLISSSVIIVMVKGNIIIPKKEIGIIPHWDKNMSDFHYRIQVKIYNNGSTNLTDSVISATINFTEELQQIGLNTSLAPFDPNSIRITEHGFGGGVVNSNISFEVEDV